MMLARWVQYVGQIIDIELIQNVGSMRQNGGLSMRNGIGVGGAGLE